MKIKTCELIGPALDWAVARVAGYNPALNPKQGDWSQKGWWQLGPDAWRPLQPYSTNWSQGGPLLDAKIGNLWKHNKLQPTDPDVWSAAAYHRTPDGTLIYCMEGPTALIAAMRCIVQSELGDEVEIPEGL